MSYSRWSNSCWYSFWSASSPDTIKEEQILALWYSLDATPEFTYKELNGFEKIKLSEHFPDATLEEIEEAFDIISEFIDDIDKEFGSR